MGRQETRGLSVSFEDYVRSVNGVGDLGSIENYTVVKVIGSGGSGKVYLVRRDGVEYAMKVPANMDPMGDKTIVRMDSESNRSYKREALFWAHASECAPDAVVRMLDYNIEPFPWAVMEKADFDFQSAIDDGTADVDDVIGLLRSLQKIHSLDVVHRDIKPQNILSVNGRWKFTDFGTSKSIGSQTTTVTGIGTPYYMAPEQISHKYGPTDFRTDVWQMGILLCHVLTGHPPYLDTDQNAICMSILADGPDLSDVPRIYHRVIKKALNFHKDDRYQTAEEFADDLESVGKAPEVEQPVVRPNPPTVSIPPRQTEVPRSAPREIESRQEPKPVNVQKPVKKNDRSRIYGILLILLLITAIVVYSGIISHYDEPSEQEPELPDPVLEIVGADVVGYNHVYSYDVRVIPEELRTGTMLYSTDHKGVNLSVYETGVYVQVTTSLVAGDKFTIQVINYEMGLSASKTITVADNPWNYTKQDSSYSVAYA